MIEVPAVSTGMMSYIAGAAAVGCVPWHSAPTPKIDGSEYSAVFANYRKIGLPNLSSSKYPEHRGTQYGKNARAGF